MDIFYTLFRGDLALIQSPLRNSDEFNGKLPTPSSLWSSQKKYCTSFQSGTRPMVTQRSAPVRKSKESRLHHHQILNSNLMSFDSLKLSGISDYRCEDGRFPVSSSCATIPNPDSLPSSETGVDPGIKS